MVRPRFGLVSDTGNALSVRKPARAILRLLDASTHEKAAIFGASVRGSVRLMAGGTGPENPCSTLIILSPRACAKVQQFRYVLSPSLKIKGFDHHNLLRSPRSRD